RSIRGIPNRAELPAHWGRAVGCIQVDYDLGRDYSTSQSLGDCPFIERVASFHSGHFAWRGRSRSYTSTVNTTPREAQRSQSTTTDCSTATESSKEYAPTAASSSTYAITSNDYSRALESQGSTSRYQKKRWRMSSLMLYEKITRW